MSVTFFFLFLSFAVPPHLKGEGMYDITLKKGRPIRYDIWFGGEPAPTVEWTRNGRTLTNDKNTSIELYSRNSIYTEKVIQYVATLAFCRSCVRRRQGL